jgi:hypothetical protein
MIGLLLFITGGIFAGMAITKSGCFPSWTGWLYGISISGFVLSNIFFSSIQSIILFMLFLSTTVVAWTVGRK